MLGRVHGISPIFYLVGFLWTVVEVAAGACRSISLGLSTQSDIFPFFFGLRRNWIMSITHIHFWIVNEVDQILICLKYIWKSGGHLDLSFFSFFFFRQSFLPVIRGFPKSIPFCTPCTCSRWSCSYIFSCMGG